MPSGDAAIAAAAPVPAAVAAAAVLPPPARDKYFQMEEDKIAFTKATVEKCEQLTKSMLGVLNAFELRLDVLERTLVPIHKQTQQLTSAQRNIEAALSETEQILTHYRVATGTDAGAEADDDVPAGGAGGVAAARAARAPQPHQQPISISVDYRGYVEWVRRVGKAIEFFTKNSGMKSAAKNLEKLKRLQADAMHECYSEFTRLMVALSKPLDLSRTSFPLPKHFELVPAAEVERLRGLVGCMDSSFFFKYMDVITQRRADVTKDSLTRSWEWFGKENERKAAAAADAADAAGLEPAGLTSPTAGSGDGKGAENELVGGYARGSHRAISQLQLGLRLIELELEQVYEPVMAEADNVGDSRYDDAFLSILAAPIKVLCKQVSEVLLLRGVNKLLILLDVLDTLTALYPRYRKVILTAPAASDPRAPELLLKPLTELLDTLALAAERALVDYRTYVETYVLPASKHRKVNSSLVHAGALYTLTIETLNFMMKLYEYKHTISSALRMQTFKTEKDYDPKTPPLTAITLMVLQALEANLESRAKTFKPAALACIFLINNFHYIAKHMTRQHQLHAREAAAAQSAAAAAGAGDGAGAAVAVMSAGMARGFAELYVDKVKRYSALYRDESWRQVLQCLDAKECGALADAFKAGAKNAKDPIKARFKQFNSAFYDLATTQRAYKVWDSDLRSQLRYDNVQLIVRPYRVFWNLFHALEFTTKPSQYKKYDVAMVEQMINLFFAED